jgi:hypothetical protein
LAETKDLLTLREERELGRDWERDRQGESDRVRQQGDRQGQRAGRGGRESKEEWQVETERRMGTGRGRQRHRKIEAQREGKREGHLDKMKERSQKTTCSDSKVRDYTIASAFVATSQLQII